MLADLMNPASTSLDQMLAEFRTLVEIVAKLRSPQGCPWDREQTQKSLTRYAIEEAHELAEAIDQGDQQAIREELGDFLFQVILQAQVAKDEGNFTLLDVLLTLNEKMIRRHPHVFSGVAVKDAAEVARNWEKIKQSEPLKIGSRRTSPFSSDPEGLPALLKSLKIGHRSEKWKFDWDTAEQVSNKVKEELGEVFEAIEDDDAHAVEEELGDLFFAVSQWARHLKVDPETALRKANRKFEIRFENMISECGLTQEQFRELPLAKKEELWQATKKRLKKDQTQK